MSILSPCAERIYPERSVTYSSLWALKKGSRFLLSSGMRDKSRFSSPDFNISSLISGLSKALFLKLCPTSTDEKYRGPMDRGFS